MGFEYLWCHCSFSHGKGRKKLHPIGRTAQTDYCRSTVLQVSKLVRRWWPILPQERTRSRRTDISSSQLATERTETQITVSSAAANHRSTVLSRRQIPLSQLGSLRLQYRRAHLPPTTIHQPSLVCAFDRVVGAGQEVSSVEEEVSGGVAYRRFSLTRLAPR